MGSVLVAPDVGNSMDLMDEHPKINGHRGLVQDLQFSPFFENILATASSDCTAKVWICQRMDYSRILMRAMLMLI